MAIDLNLPVFAFAPNWGELLRERLTFLTDVIQARAGTEQARKVRATPRRHFEFTVDASDAERQLLHAMTWRHGTREWYLPVWPDGVPLAAAVADGTGALGVDTVGRDFSAGGVACLRGETARDVELVEVAAVTDTTLTLTGTTAAAWPAGTLVYPVRKARPDENFSHAIWTGWNSAGRVRFVVTEPNPWTAVAPATIYRTAPVLETRPVTARDPTIEFTRQPDILDPGPGIAAVSDYVNMPLHRQVHDWTLDGRAALSSFRSMLYALAGTQGSLWVPSWLSDLTPAAGLGAADVALQVEWCGYTAHLLGEVNRSDVRIELRDGTVFYRRIDAAVETSTEVETLTLDSALGVAVDADDILQISFLALCRSDSDVFEFDWWTGDVADVTTAWRGRVHDL